MLRKILVSVSSVLGLFVLLFLGMAALAMVYDESDPRARPHSYHSVETVVIDRPVSEVFYFIQHKIPTVYTQMSPMHEKFEIVNADALTVGAEVDCVEGDENEVVRNRYIVTEVIENRLIAMSSRPTKVYNRNSGELVAEVDVWDYFDFEAVGPNRARLTQTVVLDMKSPFTKALFDILAFVTGTRGDWERQFSEQLQNLAAFARRSNSVEFEEANPS